MREFGGTARFRVVRRLGEGAFGVVYEAMDVQRDERVALKTLTRMDARAIYRFKREFRALADVTHENLVPLHELVAEGDEWFFTMGLVEGRDWLAWVRGTDGSDSVSPYTPTALADAPVADTFRSDAGAIVDLARLRATLPQLASGISALHGVAPYW